MAAIAAFCDETFDSVKHIELKYTNVAVYRLEKFLLLLVDKKKKMKRKDLDDIFEKLKPRIKLGADIQGTDIINILTETIADLELRE
jgi:hypothetical protein